MCLSCAAHQRVRCIALSRGSHDLPEVLVIGCSTGGPNALMDVWRGIPKGFPVPIVMVQHMPPIFDMFLDPHEKPGSAEQAEADLKKIKIPSYTGSGWYGYTYKTHLNGAQNYYATIDAPKKLMFSGPAHVERPFHSFHREMLKWFDHWLRGVDTDVMREPPVKLLIRKGGHGNYQWRGEKEWPLARTRWTKFYLEPRAHGRGGERRARRRGGARAKIYFRRRRRHFPGGAHERGDVS